MDFNEKVGNAVIKRALEIVAECPNNGILESITSVLYICQDRGLDWLIDDEVVFPFFDSQGNVVLLGE
jgi:hypothetical protein